MKKYTNTYQCLILILTCIILIITLIFYSYKNKFNTEQQEHFTDGETIVFDSSDKIDINDLVKNINLLKPSISSIHELKAPIYNNYDIDKITQYKNQGEFKISDKIFNFEEGKFALNFYQNMQDTEIKELDNKYNNIKRELEELGLNKNNDDYKYIKHNISGMKLRILNYNSKAYDSEFNIMFNIDKGICIEFINTNNTNNSNDNNNENDNINSLNLFRTENNIGLVACDKALNTNNFSDNLKARLQKQKFKFKVINNNVDYNNSLHPNYRSFKVPDYYQLNNYPYILIYPSSNSKSSEESNPNDKMALTISNNHISIEPCSGTDNQKFTLLTN